MRKLRAGTTATRAARSLSRKKASGETVTKYATRGVTCLPSRLSRAREPKHTSLSGAVTQSVRRVQADGGRQEAHGRCTTPKSPMKLVFQDGTAFHGTSFGAQKSMAGEVVFNTGMVGYVESLTDPSYAGQILVFTYPLVGNYGVPDMSQLDRFGLPANSESKKIQVAGVVVCDYSEDWSHWKATQSLGEWCASQGIPAISGVDTRELTKRIRDQGALLGKLQLKGDAGGEALPFDDPNERNLVAEVSRSEPQVYGDPDADVEILAIDVGFKNSIIRDLTARGARVKVVPWDHDISKEKYDGLFISNGPGDPTMAAQTIENLKGAIAGNTPIFGICLGTQLLALAAGGTTHKMKYGHRSHNQPCIDQLTQACYITSQNHGYVVSLETLPSGWRPYFLNDNDKTIEGIIHEEKPFFATQFHPEANGGPIDTKFLFDKFLKMARRHKAGETVTASEIRSIPGSKNVGARSSDFNVPLVHTLLNGDSYLENISLGEASALSPMQPREKPALPKKVLILGSGGLQIGQAGEFDYSGSQAIKALKEEGIKVILMNPNIATVQTAEGLADEVYFVPVIKDFVTAVIEKERPDGIMLQFGGQTALNTGLELSESGVLGKYGVSVLGTGVDTIRNAEDREIFADKLKEIGEKLAPSIACDQVDDCLLAAAQLGYPCVLRAAFALGGLGSGFAHNDAELRDLAIRALTSSPQVLIEKSIKGWKEVEYEVVRDAYDNCVTVCNMENYDPLGIHTGDSIVVAPSQTIDDHEYHMLRMASIRTVRHMGVVGECNVQFALDPVSREYCIIEINPRLSRSSALASKATGYPLAFVAAKLALGYSLPSLRNSITKVTGACFEPSLDYIVTKIPKWDLDKFDRVSNKLGTSMKSVGEVMAIGRSFEESFQKAIRMVNPSVEGFVPMEFDNLEEVLAEPTDQRYYAVAAALDQGYSVEDIQHLTNIDPWYLYKNKRINDMRKALGGLSAGDITTEHMEQLKKAGFSDKGIAQALGDDSTEDSIRAYRKEMDVTPKVKQIDTLAAEYPAQTNYLYTTYNATHHDLEFGDSEAMILGGGTYRIGSSVEFDYGAVIAARTLRDIGKKTIMINYNPETVSTDYDETDRLYFEELSLERVLDIYDLENPTDGAFVSFGGQIPNNLALPLQKRGVKIIGTDPERIDNAEDRNKFSAMLDTLGISQPEWAELASFEEAKTFADRVTYPVLCRPSYVLSGGGMQVIRGEDELRNYLGSSTVVSADFPVVISKFIEGAKEADIDAIASHGEVVSFAIASHIEAAGVHSGDATMVLPPHNLSQAQQDRILEIAQQMSQALEIHGPFNSQLIVTDDDVKVIECNVRGSRSLPFVAKTIGINLPELATKIMIGAPWEKPVQRPFSHIGVKAPQFSFTRLLGADPLLGVDMSSTGEVACFGDTYQEAFLKAMLSTHFKLPRKSILLSTGSEENKDKMVPYIQKLSDLGYEFFATPGTAVHMERNGFKVTRCYFPLDGANHPQAKNLLSNGDIDLVVNVPSKDKVDYKDEMQNCYMVRRHAVDFSVPIITDFNIATTLFDSIINVTAMSAEPYSSLWERPQ